MTETVATGLHVAILLCAGIAAAYLGAMVVQLRRLKHKQRAVVTSACEPSIGQKISVEAELQRISLEISRLRSELGAARNEVRQLRSEHYAASVAPRYNEAMAFARRGFTAPGIATRCGISMGEAELVAALARNSKDVGMAVPDQQQPRAVNDHDEQQRLRAAA